MPKFAGDLIDFHRLADLLRAKARLLPRWHASSSPLSFAWSVPERIYESRAVIQVHQEAQNVVNITDMSEENPQTNDYLNTNQLIDAVYDDRSGTELPLHL